MLSEKTFTFINLRSCVGYSVMKTIPDNINIQKGPSNNIPTAPYPASSVLLTRQGGDRPEVFMMKRSLKTNFGGAWVFPGGKIDKTDDLNILADHVVGITEEKANRILGVKEGGLRYWVGAVRECFEESGVLLAYRKTGVLFDDMNSGEQRVLSRFRSLLNNGEKVLSRMCQSLEIRLALDRLVYLSHWTTPTSEFRRYSTRFFVVAAPKFQNAFHDGSEMVDSIWITPESALDRGGQADFPLMLPTRENLKLISGFKDNEALIRSKEKVL